MSTQIYRASRCKNSSRDILAPLDKRVTTVTMSADRPSTPPPRGAASNPGVLARSPLTPEQTRRIVRVTEHQQNKKKTNLPLLQELNRLKAKALRDQHEAEARRTQANQPPSNRPTSSNNAAAGQKRPYAAISTSNVPATLRDGRNPDAGTQSSGFNRPLDSIQPARNFAKYVEYDFSKMTDTKGGFLTAEDDPHNRALHAPGSADERPAHLTLKEWERLQLLRALREQKAGPFEPGLSVLKKGKGESVKCRECGGLEVDFKWEEVFGCAVCNACKEKVPERYSLLTKTEAKEDYLLTDRMCPAPSTFIPRLFWRLGEC